MIVPSARLYSAVMSTNQPHPLSDEMLAKLRTAAPAPSPRSFLTRKAPPPGTSGEVRIRGMKLPCVFCRLLGPDGRNAIYEIRFDGIDGRMKVLAETFSILEKRGPIPPPLRGEGFRAWQRLERARLRKIRQAKKIEEAAAKKGAGRPA